MVAVRVVGAVARTVTTGAPGVGNLATISDRTITRTAKAFGRPNAVVVI